MHACTKVHIAYIYTTGFQERLFAWRPRFKTGQSRRPIRAIGQRWWRTDASFCPVCRRLHESLADFHRDRPLWDRGRRSTAGYLSGNRLTDCLINRLLVPQALRRYCRNVVSPFLCFLSVSLSFFSSPFASIRSRYADIYPRDFYNGTGSSALSRSLAALLEVPRLIESAAHLRARHHVNCGFFTPSRTRGHLRFHA